MPFPEKPALEARGRGVPMPTRPPGRRRGQRPHREDQEVLNPLPLQDHGRQPPEQTKPLDLRVKALDFSPTKKLKPNNYS